MILLSVPRAAFLLGIFTTAAATAAPSAPVEGSYVCVHESRLGASIETVRDLLSSVESATLLRIQGQTAYFGDDDLLDKAEFSVRSNHNAVVILDQVVMFDGSWIAKPEGLPADDEALDAVSNTLVFDAGSGDLHYHRVTTARDPLLTVYRFSCMER